MRFIAGILVPFILYTLYAIPVISAHTFGQPPFFKVNGEYANLYPVPVTSLYNFDLPQDLAPGNYLLNQPINFEMDKGRLPAPPEIVLKTKFSWDLGDGTHAQGLSTTHTYTRGGSYILKIYADDGTTPNPQLLESALINILPQSSYQLPQAKILINGKESHDPLSDVLSADLKDSLPFDGSKSTSSNKITEYFWDFGDQKSGFGVNQAHTYPKDLSQIFIVLRIKDENGFLSDNFVEIQNTQNGKEQNSTTSSPVKKSNQLPLSLLSLVILIGLIVIARWWLLGRRREKHQ